MFMLPANSVNLYFPHFKRYGLRVWSFFVYFTAAITVCPEPATNFQFSLTYKIIVRQYIIMIYNNMEKAIHTRDEGI